MIINVVNLETNRTWRSLAEVVVCLLWRNHVEWPLVNGYVVVLFGFVVVFDGLFVCFFVTIISHQICACTRGIPF